MFGLQDRFAVEADVYTISAGNVLGHICLWAANQRIGVYEQNVLLQTPALFFREFLDRRGWRNHFTLEAKPKTEVLRIVDWALYSDGEQSQEEHLYLPYREFAPDYQRCEVCPRLSPSFDGSLAVLLEYQHTARFIWRACEATETLETFLRLGECQAAMRGFVDFVGAAELGILGDSGVPPSSS